MAKTTPQQSEPASGGSGLITLVLVFVAIGVLIAILVWPDGSKTAGTDDDQQAVAAETESAPPAEQNDQPEAEEPEKEPPAPEDRPPASDTPDGPEPKSPPGPGAANPDPAATTTASSGGRASAMIEFDQFQHDFGRMSDTETRECTFSFTNIGGSVLRIEKVTAACACTNTTLDKWEYQPGESGTIKTTFAPTKGGSRREIIAVVSNAKPEGLHKLYVVAEVTEFLTIEPRTVRFGAVMRGQRQTTRFSVSCKNPNLVIEEVTSTHPHVSAELLDTTPGTNRMMVQVTLDEETPWGLVRDARLEFTARGTLDGGRDVEKQASVLVLGTVVDQFRASRPGVFALGPMLPGATFRSKSLTITHAARLPFELVDVEIVGGELADLSVAYEHATADQSGGYTITVSGKAGQEDGFISGVVRFTTRGPGETPEETREIGITGKIDSELKDRDIH